MAGKGTIGGKIVLEGESEYRAALKNIKSDQSELRSEMKLCQSTFKESQNSLDALTKKHEILTKQVETQAKKIDVYRQAMETSEKKEEESAKKVTELQTSLQKAETELDKMKNSSETTAEALDDQSKAVEELKTKLKLAEEAHDKASQKTNSYKTAINNAEAELQNMQRDLESTDKYMAEAEKTTDKCATSIDEYGKETEEASKQTTIFGDVLKANLTSEAIISGIKAIATGIKTIATAAMETGSSFEASMSQVAATMGMSADEVENGSEAYTILKDAAEECGKATMFSATEAGDALNYLALAGYDAEKAAETLPKVLDLAAAGGLDLAYASDLVTDSMAAMGMETDQLDNYIDEMAKTSQKSNTSVAQLGEATLVCAGTASLAKMSLETMNTELGILANNGIKGAEGGTHLRNVILSLSAPTDTATMAIEKLGLQVTDSQGNMRDLNDIMVDFNLLTSEMSATEKTQLIAKIFNKTDIAAVNALMKGSGEEFKNLNEQIRNASGSAKAMAETLNNNLKGKVTILQSSLEGLGISAYGIFDNTMKEAVDSATSAVGRLQNSIDKGDLGVSLNKMSDALADVAENAIDVGEDALPVVIDGFTWVLDNGDLIIAGLSGIAAAQIEMAVAPKIVQACTIAWENYQLVTQGAATWQEALNITMAANPAGLLVTAITTLTVAVGAYILMNKDNLVQMDEVTKKTYEQIDAAKQLEDSYETNTSARKTNRENMETETTNCKKLVDELKDLQSKTNLTTQEQARQNMIVDELNQAIPELSLSINEQTGELNMSTEALEKNVDAMMAQARAEAAREDLTQIAKDQYEAEKALADLQDQMVEQTQLVTDAKQAEAAVMASLQEQYGDMTELYGTQGMAEALAVSQAVQAQEDLQAQIDSTQSSIEGYTTQYAETMKYISDTEALATASEATGELGDAAESAGGKFAGMSADVQAAMIEMQTDLNDTITKQMSLFDEFSVKSELTTEQLLGNMQSQVDGISSWADNMQALADRGIDQGLLKSLADMGPEGAGYVATFVSMTDEELQKANDLFTEACSIPSEATDKIMDSYLQAGENAVQGFQEGIAGGAESVAESATEMADGALDAAKTALDINSPSKETEQIGAYFDEGLGNGIKDNQQPIIDTIQFMAAEMVRTTQNGLQTTTFQTIGKQITEGLKQGIESGKSGVVNAIVRMCEDAVKSAKKSLDINSPSKKFEYMGEMSGEGYIEGWKGSMEGINDIIAQSLPDTSMGQQGNGAEKTRNLEHGYNINQEINIYSQTDDLIETTRKFKQSQKEAAEAW